MAWAVYASGPDFKASRVGGTLAKAAVEAVGQIDPLDWTDEQRVVRLDVRGHRFVTQVIDKRRRGTYVRTPEGELKQVVVIPATESVAGKQYAWFPRCMSQEHGYVPCPLARKVCSRDHGASIGCGMCMCVCGPAPDPPS